MFVFSEVGVGEVRVNFTGHSRSYKVKSREYQSDVSQQSLDVLSSPIEIHPWGQTGRKRPRCQPMNL